MNKSYKKADCCDVDCDWINNEQACWGQVTLVGRDDLTDDWVWIHACEAHEEYWETGRYIPEK